MNDVHIIIMVFSFVFGLFLTAGVIKHKRLKAEMKAFNKQTKDMFDSFKL